MATGYLSTLKREFIPLPAKDGFIDLKAEFISEDGWYFDFDRIRIKFSRNTLINLNYAKVCMNKEKRFQAIEIACDSEIEFCDENGKIDEQFDPIANFQVTKSGIKLYAVHTYNGQAYTFSEEFQIRKGTPIKIVTTLEQNRFDLKVV